MNLPYDVTLADQVLRLCLQGITESQEIADNIGIDTPTAKAIIRDINEYFPKHFSKNSGKVILSAIIPIPGRIVELQGFINSGGFTAVYNKQKELESTTAEFSSMAIEKLRLDLEAARDQALGGAAKADRRARSANRAAWIAGITALATLAWELFKYFRS